MKRLKFFIHLWIAAASTISFLGGWMVFSQSAKPATVTALPAPMVYTTTALAPIPSLDSLMTNTTSSQTATLQQLPSLQLAAQSSPAALVTRGS